MTREMHRLDMLKSAQLVDYVAKNYAADKMTDVVFAEKATKELGFKVLNTHIEKRRVALGIPSTTKRSGPKTTKALFELIAELETRIVALENRV